MSVTALDAHGLYDAGASGADVYAGGGYFANAGSGSSWTAAPRDLAFRTYVSGALAATFRSLGATRTGAGALVRWRTASEVNLAGFNVYREVNGRRVRVSSRVIAAHGSGLYSYRDRRAPRGKALRYWIQAVNLDGSRAWYGPASVRGAG